MMAIVGYQQLTMNWLACINCFVDDELLRLVHHQPSFNGKINQPTNQPMNVLGGLGGNHNHDLKRLINPMCKLA